LPSAPPSGYDLDSDEDWESCLHHYCKKIITRTSTRRWICYKFFTVNFFSFSGPVRKDHHKYFSTGERTCDVFLYSLNNGSFSRPKPKKSIKTQKKLKIIKNPKKIKN
jgi:hypothetical protein